MRFDPEFILEQVAKAPREFDLQARNPANTAHIGGDHMVFAPVYGCPFIREGDVRRDAKMADFENLVRLAQTFAQLDSPGGTICEPEDRPLDSRHLDMVFALQTLSDKPYMGSVTSGPNAADTIAMGEILFGGREAIERAPASISLINVNSPLRYDDRMLAAMVEYCKASQAVVITPFLLMGAMSPVSLPATLVQQIAEALAGIALAQLIRPGVPGRVRVVPVQHRHAVGLTVVRHAGVGDRRAVHRPDRAALRPAVARRRRSERVPDRRRPGGVRVADDIAADVPGGHELRHALGRAGSRAGWSPAMRSSSSTSSCCASCATSSRRSRSTRRRSRSTRTTEVGAGGHFLGAAHTLERFRECFYRPLLSSTENFDRWTKRGARDTTARAGEIWRETLESYEQPPLDDAIRAELEEFVVRRRAELGD